MKFTMFETESRIGLAVSDGTDTFHGLFENESGYPGDLESLLAKGVELSIVGKELNKASEVDLSQVKILPPIRKPGKILCIGLNYHAHAEETGHRKTTKYPEVFARFASTLIGHGAPLVKPVNSDQLDYEGEMAVVIGRPGRYIPKNLALEHVAGYSIFNDVSIRDFQLRVGQWTMGKNFDTSGPFGPWLVTPDELPLGAAGLELTTRLNGQIMQKANTNDLIFDIASLIEYLSSAMTLHPGDVIITGTPGGVGMSRVPQVFMKPGDICQILIDGIGILQNTITC
jgi:2-keto-4-pentenoate hydratase/2-oxohepta-3-ene-1,7-dioic acid hydratase in catechol pathway